MLPDSINLPAFTAKELFDFPITALVPGDFGFPIIHAGLGHAAMPAAAMPEAAVYKDNEALAAKYEVRAPRHPRMTSPAGDSSFAENAGQPQLSGFITARADRCHDLRTLTRFEYIGHGGEYSPTSTTFASEF